MLIASDLDGTLLGPESKLTQRTIDAIAAAQASGIEVAAATGRSWRSALDKVAPTSIRYVICSNGGSIWDRETDGVLLHRPLSGADADVVIDAVRSAHDTAGFGWETLAGFDFDQAFKTHCATVDEVGMGDPVGPIGIDDEVTKLFICIPGLESAELQEAVHAAIPPIAQGAAPGRFVELTTADVDKGSTLAWLADHLGIAQPNVVAIGDQLNDVSMLTWAGTGVSMANAHPGAVAAANQRTGPNSEDGAAQVIERLTAEHTAAN